jgi:sugar lactone lactonase YvrE
MEFPQMLKKIGLLLLMLVSALTAYLLLWPVPIEPVAWKAPSNNGYTGQFSVNKKLSGLQRLSIGEHHGPEDVAGRMENGEMVLYTSTQTGDIIRIVPSSNSHEVVVNTGGVALGLQFDAAGNIIVADAHRGLLQIDTQRKVTVLSDQAEKQSPILYADELDIAADGKIYFSDASTKFGAKAAGSTMEGSLLELMDLGSTGRVLVYNPVDKSTNTISSGMSFPNGIAMCPKDACILIAETGTYSVKRLWLKGPKIGAMETVIDNLPGFPDNINRGQNGRYWLGLTSPRAQLIDDMAAQPLLRKVIMRLPQAIRPGPVNYGFVMAIDHNGKVLEQFQDASGGYPLTTGATEPGDGWLYIGSLGATYLGRKNLQE